MQKFNFFDDFMACFSSYIGSVLALVSAFCFGFLFWLKRRRRTNPYNPSVNNIKI